jgi:hypothetical protein
MTKIEGKRIGGGTQDGEEYVIYDLDRKSENGYALMYIDWPNSTEEKSNGNPPGARS